jgi:hypothetical protein
MNDRTRLILLEQLAEQYKIYREEFRGYLSFTTNSGIFLVAFFVGVLGFARDYPQVLVLVPVGVLSYIGLIAVLRTYAMIASTYCELIERQINTLLDTTCYRFESEYAGPKMKGGDTLPFIVMWTSIGILPVVVTFYAIWLSVADTRARILYVMVIMLAFFLVAWAVIKAIALRNQWKEKHLNEWLTRYGNLPPG